MHASVCKWRPGLWAAALFVSGLTPDASPAQSRTAQVLVLPDPTPREPDLEKRFKTSPAPKAADPARIAAYNRQRFQLIGQASAHMHSLATALQSSVAQPQQGAALAQEAQVAAAIETLAANVYSAMAPAPSKTLAKTDMGAAASGTDTVQLAADTRQLAALTEALQVEVGKSSPDTLAMGVLLRSAQVKELAHSLRQRLQPDPVQHP